MKRKKSRLHGSLDAVRAPGIVAAAALMVCTGASAFQIETDNPDVEMRFDNSLRYNLGLRAGKPSAAALNTADFDESTGKFKRGDVVTNRIDLLSEFDMVYKKRNGFRVSAAAWYDAAYSRSVRPNAAFDSPFGNTSASYPGGRYTDFVKRWNAGPSGEILDAFVFGGVDLGSVPLDVKFGQHNVYWGQSLFSFTHGVSHAQGPVDLRKAFANPGVEAKELFLPLNQISATAQLAPNFSVAGQYMLDWAPSRLPDGGTYLGLSDYITAGGGTYVYNQAAVDALGAMMGGLPPGTLAPVPFAGIPVKPKTRGDWGIRASWRPEALDGTLGFYYREYTDKLPQIVAGGIRPDGLPSDIRLSYLEGAKLFGVSLAKEFGGVSVGSELVYRKNGGLLMSQATVAGQSPVATRYTPWSMP